MAQTFKFYRTAVFLGFMSIVIHNIPKNAEKIVFHPAIEILRNDHKTSSHFVIGADIICSIKASVERVLTSPDEHVFGPGQNPCSIPKWYAPKAALKNAVSYTHLTLPTNREE